MSNSTSISEEPSFSSETRALEFNTLTHLLTPNSPHHHHPPQPNLKKKRSQPGNPDPDAEVVALSPKTLMATNRFICEICNKGFQRDQNLQLHKRGHNLPWKLRQKSSKEKEAVVRKRVYVCPEQSCVHHHPSRALGDITGIKKHFSRKHGEKKWKCERCGKKYAVHSDWKAHAKTCGTREYRCHCGILFSRKDSFVTHRAFCDALAEECARLNANPNPNPNPNTLFLPWGPIPNPNPIHLNPEEPLIPPFLQPYNFQATNAAPYLSATALLQKASTMGALPATVTGGAGCCNVATSEGVHVGDISTWQGSDRLTRDFLGVVTGEEELLSLTDLGLDLVTASACDRGGDHTTKPLDAFGFCPVTRTWENC